VCASTLPNTPFFSDNVMDTILLVEDESEVHRTVRDMLERAGYRVVSAAEGTAALILYGLHRPELVITDIFMPVKDGIELIREIHAVHPEAKIIAISGGGLRKNVRRRSHAGKAHPPRRTSEDGSPSARRLNGPGVHVRSRSAHSR
jgi:CheY-like chemotaxis protein